MISIDWFQIYDENLPVWVVGDDHIIPSQSLWILVLRSTLWADIISNQYNALCKHDMSLTVDHTIQFYKCFMIYACVDCGVLKYDIHKQNSLNIPKHNDLPSRVCLFEFHLDSDIHISFPSDYMSSRIYHLVHSILSEGQMHCLLIYFVLFCKYLQHPEHISHTVISQIQFLMWKIQEIDIILNRLISIIFFYILHTHTKSSSKMVTHSINHYVIFLARH